MSKKFLSITFYSTCISVILIIGFLYTLNHFGYINIFNRNIKNILVNGNSMYPYYKNGQKLKADFNYSSNNKGLKKNDVVVADYKNALNEDLIKFVKVAPGDEFHVDEQNRVLYINDELMKNSQGKTFNLTAQNIKMLKLYEEGFNGVMPSEIYFIFGDSSGTMDSGRFGPVVRDRILAKVLN